MIAALCVSMLAGSSAQAVADVWSSHTTGKSVRGTTIKAWRFGTGSKRVLIVGGMHGNEYGDDVARALVAYLKAHPSAVPEDTEIHIVPMLNPDGIRHGTRGNARRVDLNRNFPTKDWRRTLAKGDPSRALGLTGGYKPASEPETRALLWYTRGRGFDAVVALHSKAGLITYAGTGAKAIATRMSKRTGLRLGFVGYDSTIRGSLGRYYSAGLRIPAVTVELTSPKLTTGLRGALVRTLE